MLWCIFQLLGCSSDIVARFWCDFLLLGCTSDIVARCMSVSCCFHNHASITSCMFLQLVSTEITQLLGSCGEGDIFIFSRLLTGICTCPAELHLQRVLIRKVTTRRSSRSLSTSALIQNNVKLHLAGGTC